MLKIKCTCGMETTFNKLEMCIPKEPGSCSFSGFECMNCGKKIAIIGADADKNSINVLPKKKEDTK